MRMAVLLGCMLSFCFVGCGGGDGFPPPVPVSGKVLVAGKPVDGAAVTFLSKSGGRSASGKTDKDGRFKLTSVKTDDGASPGEFAVTISKQVATGGGSADVDISKGYGESYGKMQGAAASGNMDKAVSQVLPAKYADPLQSGLVRSVVKGDKNEFDFDLK